MKKSLVRGIPRLGRLKLKWRNGVTRDLKRLGMDVDVVVNRMEEAQKKGNERLQLERPQKKES